MTDLLAPKAPGRPNGALHRIGHGASVLAGLRDFPILLVLVAIIAVVSVFHSAYLESDSLINIGQLAAYYGSMAIGTVFLLSMREIDLSVGAIFGLAIVIGARLMEVDVNPWLAAFLALCVGPLCGLFNGVVANLLRIQTIVVTLGTMSMFSAIALLLSGSRIIVDLPLESSFYTALGRDYLGVPTSVWVFAILTVAVHVLYRHTRFGAKVRAIGANPEAARLAGIDIARTRIVAMMFQGLLCSTIGVITLAYLQAADPITGKGYELSVIAAAIIGGTGLNGGQGSVIGAAIGALIISAIGTGLVQFGVDANWGIFATGAMIIGAVALEKLLRSRRLEIRAHAADAEQAEGGEV
jgi:ribose transport system permease protein